MQQVVLDANVIIKLFWEEPDTQTAVELLEFLFKNQIYIVVPELFLTETFQVALAKGVPKETLLNFFEKQIDKTLFTAPLTFDLIKHASTMTETGSQRSGFPSFFDSLYQVLAQQLNTTFITADNAHLAKTKHLGNIVLLKDWRSVFL